MKAMYNLRGTERKRLVDALSQITGAEAHYNGTPSYSYTVGSFQIDQHGTIAAGEGTDTDTFERTLEQLYMNGFLYSERDDGDAPSVDAPDPAVPEPNAARDSADTDSFEISLPIDGMTDEQFAVLQQLIASKASLIKKALVAEDLTVIRAGDTLTFPWFRRMLGSSEIETYTHFIAALTQTARTQRRVPAQDREVTSERFSFRVFLLKLGFGGREYAQQRKLLYTHLTGSCAFSNAEKREEHTARWKEIRQQQRGAQVNRTADEAVDGSEINPDARRECTAPTDK